MTIFRFFQFFVFRVTFINLTVWCCWVRQLIWPEVSEREKLSDSHARSPSKSYPDWLSFLAALFYKPSFVDLWRPSFLSNYHSQFSHKKSFLLSNRVSSHSVCFFSTVAKTLIVSFNMNFTKSALLTLSSFLLVITKNIPIFSCSSIFFATPSQSLQKCLFAAFRVSVKHWVYCV